MQELGSVEERDNRKTTDGAVYLGCRIKISTDDDWSIIPNFGDSVCSIKEQPNLLDG